jgi:hypothetical protein
MYQDYISWIDLILLPIYFIILYGILVIFKKLNPHRMLVQKYLLKGYVFKVICAIFYCCLIYYYYGYGDSIQYFNDVLLIKQQLSIGNETWKVLFEDPKYIRETYDIVGPGNEGGWLLERIALLLSYISFSRFLIVSLFFATFAYSGVFKMLETFHEVMPEWHRRLALIVLFFPSLSIYGSGILKDTLCIASIGWMIYSGNKLFMKKKFTIRYLVIFIISFLIIYTVKIYILAAFIIPYIIYLLMLAVKQIPSKFFRRATFPLLLLFLALIYITFSQAIDDKLGNYAIEKLFDTVKEQQQSYLNTDYAESGSVFTIGNFEPTMSGFISKAPAGIVAFFYRPFLWESNKLIMLFSAIESLIILLFTVYVIFQAGIRKFLKYLLTNPFIFLCLSFSLIFAAIVGVSTLNFGTLARYRIPAIPFYLTGLLAILYHVKVLTPKKQPGNTVLSH